MIVLFFRKIEMSFVMREKYNLKVLEGLTLGLQTSRVRARQT
jgi:hypothetical protein